MPVRFGLLGPTAPFRGGISSYTTLLARAMARRGDVCFVAFRRLYPALLFPGTTQLDRSAVPLEAPCERLYEPMWPPSWWASADRLARGTPDLVVIAWWHPFFAPGVGVLARLLRRRGIPAALLCHNITPHEAGPLDRVLTSLAFSAASGFLVHGRADAARIGARYPKRPVVCSPHPTYGPLIEGEVPGRDEARGRLGVRTPRLLLFFGLIRPYKGLGDLLEALALLDPDVGLLVAGEAYESTAAYHDLARARGLQDRVVWIERYVPNEDVPQLLGAADLVVCPYRSGSQSGVVQLAYGAGCPVLVTDVGGLADVVTDGRTGLVVPPGDPPAIAAAVRRFYAEGGPATYGPRVVADRGCFGWDSLLDALEDLSRRTGMGARDR